MTEAIEVHSVRKDYRVPSVLPWRRARVTHALADVSFSCPGGRITCLLGPNGAGKTTILKILAGLILPDAGSVSALGVPLESAPRALRRRIGVAAPNERSFYWRLTGRQNLEFFAALYDLDRRARRRRTAEVLAEVELEDAADTPFRLYSAGMKQKLILARALLPDPDVLLLDEPTAHLDALVRQRVRALICRGFAGERGATVLLCTHDLAEAEELADHLVFLDRGRVLEEGSLPELRARLGATVRVTLGFSRAPAPGWEKTLAPLAAAHEGLRTVLELSAAEDIPRAVEAAVAAGGRIVSVQREEEALADMFARLAGEAAP